jgi:ArsR family transcriptional regulator, arsenate/arsenite/antimonite-responsive transcriptional repressor
LRNIKIKKVSIQFSEDDKHIARITKAIGHPARVHILRKLAKMNSCCYSGDLADELPIARSTLSQHLKELKYAGLIQGEINPPFIKYCINRENWLTAKRLLQDLLDEDQNGSDISCIETYEINPDK